MLRQQRFGRRSLLPHKPDALWKIEIGVVRTLTWLEDGTVIATGLWGPGDVIGNILSKSNPYQMECLTEVEASILPIDNCYTATEALFTHIQQAEELSVIRSYKKAEEILFRLLVWLAKKFGREVARGHLIDLRLTHQDLAELLHITRVTITRTLNQFERQGLIDRKSRRLMVLHEEEFWHYEI